MTFWECDCLLWFPLICCSVVYVWKLALLATTTIVLSMMALNMRSPRKQLMKLLVRCSSVFYSQFTISWGWPQYVFPLFVVEEEMTVVKLSASPFAAHLPPLLQHQHHSNQSPSSNGTSLCSTGMELLVEWMQSSSYLLHWSIQTEKHQFSDIFPLSCMIDSSTLYSLPHLDQPDG